MKAVHYAQTAAVCFILFVFVLAALPQISKITPYRIIPSGTVPSGEPLTPPSPAHWFGTDDLGIDIFASLCYGAQHSLAIAGFSAVAAAIGGCVIGMFAGYKGGMIDHIFLGIADFFISVPDLLLMVVLGAFLGPSLKNTVLAISLVSWIAPAKIARSELLKIKKERYIILATAYGAHFPHLFVWHFWKPLFSIITVSMIRIMNRALLTEASLAYLGLGDPLSKSWGITITRAMDFPNIYLTDFWKWWLVFPVCLMVGTVLSVAVIGQKIEQRVSLKNPVSADRVSENSREIV